MNDFRGKHLPRIGITVGASDGWRDDGASYNSYAAAISSVGGDPVAAGLRGERSMGSLNGLLVPGGWDVHPSRYSRMPGDEELTDAEVLERYEIHTEEERDEAELNLIRQALAANKPLLAICRGVQSLNVVLARKLIPDIGKCVPDAITHVSDGGPGPSVSHVARLTPGSLIERVYGAPETFLVDADGVVRWKHVGPLTDAKIAGELIPALEQLEAAR